MIGFSEGPGGMTGAYWNLGCRKAMEKINLQPDISAGISAGAITAGMLNYMNIVDAEQMLFSFKKKSDIFKNNVFTDIQMVLGHRLGRQDISKVSELIRKVWHMPPSYESYAIYWNVNKRVIEWADNMHKDYDLMVQASSAIPVMHVPVVYKNELLVDGGNFIQSAIPFLKDKQCTKIYAFTKNPINPDGKDRDLNAKKLHAFDMLEMATDDFSHGVFWGSFRDYVNDPDVCIISPDTWIDHHIDQVDPIAGRKIFNMAYNKTMAVLS